MYTGEDATAKEPSPEPVAEPVADSKHMESDVQEDNAVMESTEFILIFQSESDEEESGVEETKDEEEEEVEGEREGEEMEEEGEVEREGEEVEEEEKVKLGGGTTHLRDDDSEFIISRTIVTIP